MCLRWKESDLSFNSQFSCVTFAVIEKQQLKYLCCMKNTQHIVAQVLLLVHRIEFNLFNCSFYFFLIVSNSLVGCRWHLKAYHAWVLKKSNWQVLPIHTMVLVVNNVKLDGCQYFILYCSPARLFFTATQEFLSCR